MLKLRPSPSPSPLISITRDSLLSTIKVLVLISELYVKYRASKPRIFFNFWSCFSIIYSPLGIRILILTVPFFAASFNAWIIPNFCWIWKMLAEEKKNSILDVAEPINLNSISTTFFGLSWIISIVSGDSLCLCLWLLLLLLLLLPSLITYEKNSNTQLTYRCYDIHL